ncbi:MAG: transposase [bacterium]|nr:transposase [bacterium]
MKRPVFVEGNLYHVYNRGTDKRNIFLDEEDYLRGIHDLWEFNDENPAANSYYKLPISASNEVGLRKMATVRPVKAERLPRKLLVKIHAFVLMKNHFHLLIEPLVPHGLTEFMRKFGTGYTNYFNQKYKRSGVLFQGRFKAVPITDEAHFIHLPYYIHCNPLDYHDVGWRDRKLKSVKSAMEFLENYRWSSFSDYIGRKNFPSVIHRDFLKKFLGLSDWRSAMKNWLEAFEVEGMDGYLLE